MLQEYEIQCVLGKPGGFGITYLATDTQLQQSVAIKEYLPSDFAIREGVSTVHIRSSADADSFEWGMKSFIEEARVLAKFNHPNIVKVLRFFKANNTAYMVMAYQEGCSLTDYIKDHKLDEAALLRLLLPLLDGLEQIHAAGFLHRDIKPNNIYIRHDGSPVLLDFGSARYAIGQKSRSVTSIVSPGYAPLEQYDNDADAQGPWTDIYALGAVLYFICNGEPPPPATRRVVNDPMVPMTQQVAGHFAKPLLLAIDWALESNEKDRPQSVAVWREHLQRATAIPTLPTVTDDSAPTAVCVNSWLVPVSVVTTVLLVLIGIGIAQYQYNRLLNAQSEIAALKQQLQQTQQRLTDTQNKLQITESQHQETQHLFDQVLRFEDQTTNLKRQAFNNASTEYDSTKYYDVANVSADDPEGLNIRPFPGYLSEKIGSIPADGQCVQYLNQLHFYKSRRSTRKPQLWVKVRYQNLEGWVHSNYLASNQNCSKKQTSQ